MFADEMQRLRDDPHLRELLARYVEAGAEDREAWQDRVMALEGAEARDVARLHGELIAYGWVEQNTGATDILRPGVAACCYRATAAGRRALRWSAAPDDEGQAEAA